MTDATNKRGHPLVIQDTDEGGVFVLSQEAPTLADAVRIAEEEFGFRPRFSHARRVDMTPCEGHGEYEIFYATDWREWGELKPLGPAVRYWELNT